MIRKNINELKENYLKKIVNDDAEDVVVMDNKESEIGVIISPERYQLLMAMKELFRNPAELERRVKQREVFQSGMEISSIEIEDIIIDNNANRKK